MLQHENTTITFLLEFETVFTSSLVTLDKDISLARQNKTLCFQIFDQKAAISFKTSVKEKDKE